MYSVLPQFILGFHGCDSSIAEAVIKGDINHLPASTNDYDWLGHGIYFWEHNPERALNYAEHLKSYPRRTSKGKKPIKNPAVVGAIIDLGKCLNLLESKSISVVTESFQQFENLSRSLGFALPENKIDPGSGEILRRNLDCAVIQAIHGFMEKQGIEYHSVRGVFIEGNKIYPNAGFHEKNHIQICVRNPNCIKGYFRPMNPVTEYSIH